MTNTALALPHATQFLSRIFQKGGSALSNCVYLSSLETLAQSSYCYSGIWIADKDIGCGAGQLAWERIQQTEPFSCYPVYPMIWALAVYTSHTHADTHVTQAQRNRHTHRHKHTHTQSSISHIHIRTYTCTHYLLDALIVLCVGKIKG